MWVFEWVFSGWFGGEEEDKHLLPPPISSPLLVPHPPPPSFNLTHPLPIPLFHRRTTTLHSTRNNCFCLEGVQGGGKGGALGSLCEEKGVFEGQLVNSPLSSFSSPSLYSSSIITASYCFLSFFFKENVPLLPLLLLPFSPLFLTGPADVICHV